MHKLNNIWTLWLHLPNDTDWSINSYKKLATFDTLEKCIVLIENINKLIVEKCMIFIMKDNIKPIWEDVENSKGGCFCYKFSTNLVYDIWKDLSYLLIGNTLGDNFELLDNINGISISPKKNFCIIKLWLSSIDKMKSNSIYEFLISSINNVSEFNNYGDPLNLHNLLDCEKQLCIFKKHECLYQI